MPLMNDKEQEVYKAICCLTDFQRELILPSAGVLARLFQSAPHMDEAAVAMLWKVRQQLDDTILTMVDIYQEEVMAGLRTSKGGEVVLKTHLESALKSVDSQCIVNLIHQYVKDHSADASAIYLFRIVKAYRDLDPAVRQALPQPLRGPMEEAFDFSRLRGDS